MKFLKNLEVKRNIIKCRREVKRLCDDVKYFWRTSLHDGDEEEFLRIKTTQWRHGGVLEERASLMKDMCGPVFFTCVPTRWQD